jgi:anti-sigma factor RsiW
LFLSLVSPTVRRAVRRFLHRHPKMAHAYKKWRHKGRKKRLELIRRRKALADRL